MIEATIEETLGAIDMVLKAMVIRVSGAWLHENQIAEKIHIEVNKVCQCKAVRCMNSIGLASNSRRALFCQVTNSVQLVSTIMLCLDTLSVAMRTCQDMSIYSFNARGEKLHGTLTQVAAFVEDLDDLQCLWFHLLPFAKLSLRGEVDRDSVRLFNTCTEELKKVDLIMQQLAGNVHNILHNSTGQDLDLRNLRENLLTVLDETHCTVQSALDPCPRLSLLAYGDAVQLMKLWIVGPEQDMDFVNQCMGIMFDGISGLQTDYQMSSSLLSCTGVVSCDRSEVVLLAQPLFVNLPLGEFVAALERQLRAQLEKTCDILMLGRIKCFQMLLTDSNSKQLVEHIANIFTVRLDQTVSALSDSDSNQTYLMMNSVFFAEDVWICLGYPTGAITVARRDLILEEVLFTERWRTSLQVSSHMELWTNRMLTPPHLPHSLRRCSACARTTWIFCSRPCFTARGTTRSPSASSARCFDPSTYWRSSTCVL